MCGRIVDHLTDAEIIDLYKVVGAARLGIEGRPDYNVRPTQTLRAVRLDAAGRRELVPLKWGLKRSWAPSLVINAKAETMAKAKTMWRDPVRTCRCLILVSGFYEWEKPEGRPKQPFFIHLADRPMAFAGLWEPWHAAPADAIESGVMATAAPSEEFARFHDRQVVILSDPEECDAWLDPDTPLEDAMTMLRPLPPGSLQFRPVGPAVNTMAAHGPECIEEGRVDAPAKPLKIKRPAPEVQQDLFG